MIIFPSAPLVGPDDCSCLEPGCGFLAPPRALLDHLVAQHSLRAVRITYGAQHQLVVPALTEPRRLLLLAEEDDAVFLVDVREAPEVTPDIDDILDMMNFPDDYADCSAQRRMAVSVQCLRARASVRGPPPRRYMCTVSDNSGLSPTGGQVTSCQGPGEFVGEYTLQQPMLPGPGLASKDVHLRIRIS